jgi:uncharacterized repeat protein (TIGR03803 family)
MKRVWMGLFAGAVGCAVAQLAFGAELAKPREKVLYSFCAQSKCTDGAPPASELIDVNGILYGTTQSGGFGTCSEACGTVFSLDPKTGAEKVVYSFCSEGCRDGQTPYGGVVEVNGTLYGTTATGGDYGQGVVFSLDPNTAAQSVIYSFGPSDKRTDAANPEAVPIDVQGILYGTTTEGGSYNSGAVYALDPNTGIETVLHSFGFGSDGAAPISSLINLEGMLYGTTPTGGGSSGSGSGTVFSVDPGTGAETVLYSFCSQSNCTDGQAPFGSLVAMKGILYGTTSFGGAFDSGTVFSLDPVTGAESVLYSFCHQPHCTDGANPTAGLVDANGILYGTTASGGIGNGYCGGGCGTVFAFDPATGTETALHNFCNRASTCTDGQVPEANVIVAKRTIYGTTNYGGAFGQGTVFAIKKP